MTSVNEVLQAIGIVKNEFTTQHAKQFCDILKFFQREKSNILSVKTEPGAVVMFGKKSKEEFNMKWEKNIKTLNKGIKLTGEKFIVTTKFGTYSAAVPIGNKLHDAFCDTLGIIRMPVEAKKILKSFVLPARALTAIKKARNFVSKDPLRPAMCCVKLEIENNKGVIVATDAHRLYVSEEFNVDGPNEKFECCIPASQLKKLPKLKEPTFKFELLENSTVSFLGMEIKEFTGVNFPHWRVVMPDYKNCVVFDRDAMVAKISEILPFSNKTTQRINLFFNGKILLHAEDIDFCQESNQEMFYSQKSVPDFDIDFNGKFLIESLSVFDSSEVKMLTEGQWDRCGVFTDGKEKVLIMPLENYGKREKKENSKTEERKMYCELNNYEKKAIRIYTNYLSHLFTNCNCVFVHQYTDRLKIRYIKGIGREMIKGERTIYMEKLGSEFAKKIQWLVEAYGQKIIDKTSACITN